MELVVTEKDRNIINIHLEKNLYITIEVIKGSNQYTWLSISLDKIRNIETELTKELLKSPIYHHTISHIEIPIRENEPIKLRWSPIFNRGNYRNFYDNCCVESFWESDVLSYISKLKVQRITQAYLKKHCHLYFFNERLRSHNNFWLVRFS